MCTRYSELNLNSVQISLPLRSLPGLTKVASLLHPILSPTPVLSSFKRFCLKLCLWVVWGLLRHSLDVESEFYGSRTHGGGRGFTIVCLCLARGKFSNNDVERTQAFPNIAPLCAGKEWLVPSLLHLFVHIFWTCMEQLLGGRYCVRKSPVGRENRGGTQVNRQCEDVWVAQQSDPQVPAVTSGGFLTQRGWSGKAPGGADPGASHLLCSSGPSHLRTRVNASADLPFVPTITP